MQSKSLVFVVDNGSSPAGVSPSLSLSVSKSSDCSISFESLYLDGTAVDLAGKQVKMMLQAKPVGGAHLGQAIAVLSAETGKGSFLLPMSLWEGCLDGTYFYSVAAESIVLCSPKSLHLQA